MAALPAHGHYEAVECCGVELVFGRRHQALFVALRNRQIKVNCDIMTDAADRINLEGVFLQMLIRYYF